MQLRVGEDAVGPAEASQAVTDDFLDDWWHRDDPWPRLLHRPGRLVLRDDPDVPVPVDHRVGQGSDVAGPGRREPQGEQDVQEVDVAGVPHQSTELLWLYQPLTPLGVEQR